MSYMKSLIYNDKKYVPSSNYYQEDKYAVKRTYVEPNKIPESFGEGFDRKIVDSASYPSRYLLSEPTQPTVFGIIRPH